MNTRDVKSRIAELFYNVLLCDITEEYEDFLEISIALARLIETIKPDPQRQLVQKVNSIKEQGNLAICNVSSDINDFRNKIQMEAYRAQSIGNIKRTVKTQICDILQNVLSSEKILQE